jgi:RsiW-degrading membrane proteinase PrsW (M82 family)
MSAINVASQPRTWTGIVVALAAAAGFSLANTSASLADQGGTTPLTIAATRFIVPAVALVIWMRLGGVSGPHVAMGRKAGSCIAANSERIAEGVVAPVHSIKGRRPRPVP